MSGSVAASAVTTGAPHAIASTGGRPKPSDNEGYTNSEHPVYAGRELVVGEIAEDANAGPHRRAGNAREHVVVFQPVPPHNTNTSGAPVARTAFSKASTRRARFLRGSKVPTNSM